jgi:hypothetical protein
VVVTLRACSTVTTTSDAETVGEGVRWGLMRVGRAVQDFIDLRKKVEGVRVSALNNLAACCLKERRFEDAVGFCEDVLRQSARDVKALYRLGQVPTARVVVVWSSRGAGSCRYMGSPPAGSAC